MLILLMTSFLNNDYVGDKEFIRRVAWLAKKFPTFRLKFSYFYNTESGIIRELQTLSIPFEIKHGPYYDSYAEGCEDYILYVNLDPGRDINYFTISFRVEIGKKVPYQPILVERDFNSLNTCIILRTIMDNDKFIYVSEEPEKLLREIYDAIYEYYEPAEITIESVSTIKIKI